MKYYIGLSLSSGSSMDSGVAVMEENGDFILVDKLYKMNDIIFFFENFSSLKDSEICASLAWDKTMLNGKWRILSKPYQLVSTNPLFPNQDNWTQRYATRGNVDSEFFDKKLSNLYGDKDEILLTEAGQSVGYKNVMPYISGILLDNMKCCTKEAKSDLKNSKPEVYTL